MNIDWQKFSRNKKYKIDRIYRYSIVSISNGIINETIDQPGSNVYFLFILGYRATQFYGKQDLGGLNFNYITRYMITDFKGWCPAIQIDGSLFISNLDEYGVPYISLTDKKRLHYHIDNLLTLDNLLTNTDRFKWLSPRQLS